MNSWLYSSKADSNFDEQTITDDRSERQDLSIMSDSCYDANGFTQDAANHATNICSIGGFNSSQSKERESTVLALGNP